MGGTALTCSAALILRTDNDHKKMEVRTTVGMSQDRTKVQIAASMEPYEMTFIATSKMDQPKSKWDKMSILSQELSGEVDMKLSYGERSIDTQDLKTASAHIKLYQSDDQKEFARQSREGAQCQEQTQQGRKLTEECKVSRQHASSLDRIVASVRLPKTVTENIYQKTISELSQAYVAPYITELRYKEPEEETNTGYSQYDWNIKMDPKGEKFSVSVEGGESNLVIEDIRIKVDDEEKTYIKRRDYDNRKVKEQKSQSRKIVSSQQLREEEEKSLIQREKTEFAEEKKNYYDEQTTYVTSYQDGVYAVINHAYGISVYSDGKSLE